MNAFVYCWTDHKYNKLYIGSHKGSIDDGYICSSKIMIEEYKKRPSDFSRQIIATGIFEDIRKLEETILNTLNVRDNDDYYNMHNGNGNFYNKQHTQEYKNYMSKILSNRSVSEETKKKMRENHANVIGKNNPMFGRKHSNETKEKMRQKRLGKTDDEKTRKRKSDARKGDKNPMYGKKNNALSLRNKNNPPRKNKKGKQNNDEIDS